MNKLLPVLLVLLTLNTYSQKTLDSLNYKNTQDIDFFRKIRNRTRIKKYTTLNENVIKLNDTVILGSPTSEEFNTRTYSGSYGRRGRIGVSQSRSTSKKTYEFIKMGRPAGFSSIMAGLNGESARMANNSLRNTQAIVKEIRAYHRGSRKKPLYIVIILGEINGRAFGANKYLSIMNAEFAIESGEILLKNRKMTKAEAIAKLKEAKELMEIEMMTKEEYDSLKVKLRPIIRAKM